LGGEKTYRHEGRNWVPQREKNLVSHPKVWLRTPFSEGEEEFASTNQNRTGGGEGGEEDLLAVEEGCIFQTTRKKNVVGLCEDTSGERRLPGAGGKGVHKGVDQIAHLPGGRRDSAQ